MKETEMSERRRPMKKIRFVSPVLVWAILAALPALPSGPLMAGDA